MSNNNILIDFLGAENVEDLKKRLVDEIVNRVVTDFDDYSDYIINPENIIDEISDEVVKEVKKQLVPKLQGKVYKVAMKKLGLED